jgi:ABC-type multidrug transport system ATPase subunit
VESLAFYPYLSGRRNLRIIARNASVPMSRVEAALDQVKLTQRAEDKFSRYSLAMKQRLGVAAALLKDPELLILDEPTNGLDPKDMTEMRALIRNLAQGKRTVLLSSHLLEEVEQVCDRVGVILGGKLVAEGTVAELREQGELLVRADPIDWASRLVEEICGPEQVQVSGGALVLATDTARAGEINHKLVASGVLVSELRPVERFREETFPELTRREEV